MIPVDWQVQHNLLKHSMARVLTYRDECHSYVLTACGPVGTDELTRVGDCGSRRPTGTLGSICLEGVSAAARFQVCFWVPCNDTNKSVDITVV